MTHLLPQLKRSLIGIRIIGCLAALMAAIPALSVSATDDTSTTGTGARLQALIDAAAPGSSITLPAGTFRLRTMLRITKPLAISGNPLGTRLIGGVSIPFNELPRSILQASDPWKDRFPQSIRASVRYVDLPSLIGDRAATTLGTWPTEPISVGKINPNDPRQPFLASFGEVPLRYAEMRSPLVGERWAIAASADPARPQDAFFTNEVAAWPSVAGVNASSNFRDLRCTVFAQFDYDALQTGVNELVPSTGKIGLRTSGLANSIRTNSFNSRQRFLLWNAPEFLDEPFEMVFNSELRRLYFVPPSNAAVDPDGRENPLTTLHISLPVLKTTMTTVDPTGIIIETNGVTLRQISFDTFYGNAVLAYSRTGITVDECSFRNTGSAAVNLVNCQNTLVQNSVFEASGKGHFFAQANPDGDPFFFALTRTPSGLTIQNTVFRDSGRIWPNAAAVVIGGMSVGMNIVANSFENIGGSAIVYSGNSNNILENQFTSCVQDVSEYGVIYTGRSLLYVGNSIDRNTFFDVKQRSRSGMADYVSAIMQDDFGCGNAFRANKFVDVDHCFHLNGGRFYLFDRNSFSRVSKVLVLQHWPMVPVAWNEFVTFANLLGPAGFRTGAWASISSFGAYRSYNPVTGVTTSVNDLAELADAARLITGDPNGQISAGVNLDRVMKQANWLSSPLNSRSTTLQSKILSLGNLFLYNDSDFDDPSKNPFTGSGFVSTPVTQTPHGSIDGYNVTSVRAGDPTYSGGALTGITGLRLVQLRQTRR